MGQASSLPLVILKQNVYNEGSKTGVRRRKNLICVEQIVFDDSEAFLKGIMELFEETYGPYRVKENFYQ